MVTLKSSEKILYICWNLLLELKKSSDFQLEKKACSNNKNDYASEKSDILIHKIIWYKMQAWRNIKNYYARESGEAECEKGCTRAGRARRNVKKAVRARGGRAGM